jgi:hypothetical protein
MMNAVPTRESTEPSRSVTSIAYICCSVRPISAGTGAGAGAAGAGNGAVGLGSQGLQWSQAIYSLVYQSPCALIVTSVLQVSGPRWHSSGARCSSIDLGDRGQIEPVKYPMEARLFHVDGVRGWVRLKDG